MAHDYAIPGPTPGRASLSFRGMGKDSNLVGFRMDGDFLSI